MSRSRTASVRQGSDTLAPGSYSFYDWEAFVQSPDTFKNTWSLAGGQRYDEALDGGSLQPSTRATHYSATFGLARDPRNKLALTFTYRQLEIRDSLLTAQTPQDSYLARADYGVNALKGVVTGSLFYEFGSGWSRERSSSMYRCRRGRASTCGSITMAMASRT
jgi:hypothetical protein